MAADSWLGGNTFRCVDKFRPCIRKHHISEYGVGTAADGQLSGAFSSVRLAV